MIFVGPINYGTSQARYRSFHKTVTGLQFIDTDEIYGNYLDRNFFQRFKVRKYPEIFAVEIIKKFMSLDRIQEQTVWIDTCYVAVPKVVDFLYLKRCKIILYLVDSVRSPGIENILNSCDKKKIHKVVTTKSHDVPYFLSRGIPVKLDSQRVSREDLLLFDERTKKIDLVYAADFTKQKYQELNDLIPNGYFCHVFGRNWPRTNQSLIVEGWLHGNDYFKKLNESRISVGIQNREMGDTLTTRIFEIPLSSSLLLAERIPEIYAIFGDSIVYFDEAKVAVPYLLAEANFAELRDRTIAAHRACLSRARFVEDLYSDVCLDA